MERNEALTLLKLAGSPDSTEVEKAFREREYEIEQKLIVAPPEEGARIPLNFELDRVREARRALSAPEAPERFERPSARPSAPPTEEPLPFVASSARGAEPDPSTVTLSLPPAPRALGAGPASRLKSIGGWVVRILALLAVLAAVAVYLTQLGPLSDWWRNYTRDADRKSYAESLRQDGESLSAQWSESAAGLKVDEPDELKEARKAIEKGDELFAACEDELAITAYLEATGRLKEGLAQLAEYRGQLTVQGEDTVEEIRNLLTEIEKAEWGLDRRERDASEEVQRIGENLKAARSREDRRRVELELAEARNRLALAREIQTVCRLVLESDRLQVIGETVKAASLGLEGDDVYTAVQTLSDVKTEIEGLLVEKDELARTVEEIWSCEQQLAAAGEKAGSGGKALFAPMASRLAGLRARLGKDTPAEIRVDLSGLRADVEHVERLLPVRVSIIDHAEKLAVAEDMPALEKKRVGAIALVSEGDQALLTGKPETAERSYEAANDALDVLEEEVKLALFELANRSLQGNDLVKARKGIETLLGLDPLHSGANSLRKELSDRRETRAIVVPDDASTVQAAMLAAKAGEVVRIRPGVYDGGVTFKEGVRVEGAGADRVTIRCGAKDANVVMVKNCRSGSISGVTLEHLGTDLDEHRYSGLHLENSSIQVKDVTIRNAAGNGILLTAGGASTITGCLVQGSGWFGIYFSERGGGSAVGNVCLRNSFSGIAVAAQGRHVSLTRNQAQNNGLHGIYFGEGATGTVEGNTAERNRGSGIAVRGSGAKLTVVGNHCRNNRQFGIYFDGGASGTVERNVLEENDYSGIAAVGRQTRLKLRRNKCVSNRRDGIYFFDGAGGTAEENVCERNVNSGIAAIGTDRSLVLRRNRCLSNKTWGIYFGGSAVGRAEGNVCERNTRDGIAVAETGTHATLSANRCSGNGGDGIHFAKGTAGGADRNVAEKNDGYGLYADPGSSVRVLDTTAKGNKLGNLGGKARK